MYGICATLPLKFYTEVHTFTTPDLQGRTAANSGAAFTGYCTVTSRPTFEAILSGNISGTGNIVDWGSSGPPNEVVEGVTAIANLYCNVPWKVNEDNLGIIVRK